MGAVTTGCSTLRVYARAWLHWRSTLTGRGPQVDHIEESFLPLVEKCKSLNRAMRIGANHGSLSARILSYYGDTPRGMVESAFEFARICRKNDYHNFLFSMKASNPLVMVQVRSPCWAAPTRVVFACRCARASSVPQPTPLWEASFVFGPGLR